MEIGCWLIVIGYWLLVVGYWLLVVGCWLLVGRGSKSVKIRPICVTRVAIVPTETRSQLTLIFIEDVLLRIHPLIHKENCCVKSVF
ncbi:MAG: hypothetical protein DYG98_08840 [Haliscomenobacteraceae bacterium CHB4]|nr:hypothetical protein [Haliscomenobacteraceae bacterium CHB4]